MNSVINEYVGGKSRQDRHTHARTYVQTVTHSEWGALIYTEFMVEVKYSTLLPNSFLSPFHLPISLPCMVKWNSWNIHSQIVTDSTRKLRQRVRICVFTCKSKQARLMLGWSVCGKRRMIRPIWFVLQSQIKQEWWGIDSGGLWRHGTAVATHIYTTTVPSVSEKTSKKAFWRIPS